jgi:Flp pilus assembly pilin Flp
MQFSLKILVGAILCLIALVIVVVIITGMSGDAQGSVNSLFDWFSELIGR